MTQVTNTNSTILIYNNYFKLVARNTSLSTDSVFNEFCELVTMFLPTLKSLSEGTLMAQIHK